MRTRPILLLPIAATLMLISIGCEENENTRLAGMAERQLDRQANQNRQMAELHHEVAQGSRQLVESDGKARQEMVVLHREVQSERSEIGRQRDLLEGERRTLAGHRHWDPVIAAAISNCGLILACILPLVLCWYLLHRRAEPADDGAVAEVLLDDLVANEPVLLWQRPEQRNIGLRDVNVEPRSSDD